MKDILRSILFLIITQLLFIVVDLPAQTIQPTPDDGPIKVHTLLLNVPVIVSDRNGRNITGLKKEDFVVVQGGERQAVDFFADTVVPMNVAIIIDTSGSTSRVISDIQSAALKFIPFLGPNDKAMIVSADYDVHILERLTSNQKKLQRAISSAVVAQRGGSNVLDAIYRVITNDLASVSGRKALIVLTDGDIGGAISMRELINTLIESDVLVYPIFFQTHPILPPGIKTISFDEFIKIQPIDFMNSMAVVTGGRLMADARGTNFATAFQNISDELKKQYVVGFYPKDKDGGGTNNIAISVDIKDAVIRSKRTIRIKKSGQSQPVGQK